MSAVMEASTDITEYRPTEAALSALAERYRGVLWNVTVPEEMKAAKEARAELRTYRIDLEKLRVQIKAPVLERTRLLDAEARRITLALEALESPIDEQIKSEERRKEREKAAEAERIAQIQKSISDLNSIVPDSAGKSAETIAKRISSLQSYDVSEWAQEFLDTAQKAHQSAIAALQQLHAGALAQEQAQAVEAARVAAERAELAKLRAEQEERDKRAEIAKRQAMEAEMAAQARIALAEKESRERIESAEREARLAREEADRASRKEREAVESKLKSERDRIDAEAKKVRDEAEAKSREERRKQMELSDARGMLELFAKRYGHMAEFKPLCDWITKYFAHKKAA